MNPMKKIQEQQRLKNQWCKLLTDIKNTNMEIRELQGQLSCQPTMSKPKCPVLSPITKGVVEGMKTYSKELSNYKDFLENHMFTGMTCDDHFAE